MPRQIKSPTTKGIAALNIIPIGISAMPFMTKRLIPKGGVIEAILLRIANMTPNQIKSQPKLFAIGRKMGTQINISGIAGKKHPRKQITRTIMSMTSIGAMSMPAMDEAIHVGNLEAVIK